MLILGRENGMMVDTFFKFSRFLAPLADTLQK